MVWCNNLFMAYKPACCTKVFIYGAILKLRSMILNALLQKGTIEIGFCVPSYNGICHLAAITGTTNLVTYQSAKSMDFILK